MRRADEIRAEARARQVQAMSDRGQAVVTIGDRDARSGLYKTTDGYGRLTTTGQLATGSPVRVYQVGNGAASAIVGPMATEPPDPVQPPPVGYFRGQIFNEEKEGTPESANLKWLAVDSAGRYWVGGWQPNPVALKLPSNVAAEEIINPLIDSRGGGRWTVSLRWRDSLIDLLPTKVGIREIPDAISGDYWVFPKPLGARFWSIGINGDGFPGGGVYVTEGWSLKESELLPIVYGYQARSNPAGDGYADIVYDMPQWFGPEISPHKIGFTHQSTPNNPVSNIYDYYDRSYSLVRVGLKGCAIGYYVDRRYTAPYGGGNPNYYANRLLFYSRATGLVATPYGVSVVPGGGGVPAENIFPEYFFLGGTWDVSKNRATRFEIADIPIAGSARVDVAFYDRAFSQTKTKQVKVFAPPSGAYVLAASYG